jgi:hypothetical protein
MIWPHGTCGTVLPARQPPFINKHSVSVARPASRTSRPMASGPWSMTDALRMMHGLPAVAPAVARVSWVISLAKGGQMTPCCR